MTHTWPEFSHKEEPSNLGSARIKVNGEDVGNHQNQNPDIGNDEPKKKNLENNPVKPDYYSEVQWKIIAAQSAEKQDTSARPVSQRWPEAIAQNNLETEWKLSLC